MKTWEKIALGAAVAKALIISIVLALPACLSDTPTEIQPEEEIRSMASPITLTEANFEAEVIESPVPVLVDFWASWCGPCHMLAPVIEEVAVDFEGRAKVGKLEVDAHSEIAMEYGIRSIPSLLFFRNGQVVDQLVGLVSKEAITEKLGALAGETEVVRN